MKSLIFCAVALATAFVSNVSSQAPALDQGTMKDCAHGSACQPAGGTACKRKARLDLRFILDAAEHAYNVDINGTETPVNTFFFCPAVDELQAFSLNHSARNVLLAKDDKWADPSNFDQDTNLLNVSVYDMGRLPKPGNSVPNPDDDSSTVVAEFNSTRCPPINASSPTFYNDKNNSYPLYGTLWVNFLVLNITMTKGNYLYDDGFSQPIQSGFAPTCDETDHCKLFDQGHCIGKPGRRNCAKCVAKVTDILDDYKNIDLKIWASYYGSDADGRKFLSGSENPLAFTQFSAAPIFEKVGGELGAIERKL